MAAAPIMFLYETPYPVALRKKVKGFVQIPLGNNIFVGASAREVDCSHLRPVEPARRRL